MYIIRRVTLNIRFKEFQSQPNSQGKKEKKKRKRKTERAAAKTK